MHVGIAADHGGYELREYVGARLRQDGHIVTDFGADMPEPGDEYPDSIAPLAQTVAHGEVKRGVAICGSGVDASIAANKVPGVRATLIHDHFPAHQGVNESAYAKARWMLWHHTNRMAVPDQASSSTWRVYTWFE
jgi:ribose 5-phosphate isomerase B